MRGRYLVKECCQPGWGSDEWEEVGRFENLADAMKCQKDYGHFMSRDIVDLETGKCVVRGWRIGDDED